MDKAHSSSPFLLSCAARKIARLAPLILSWVPRATSRDAVALVRAATRRAVSRREALAGNELTAVAKTHVLRPVTGLHGTTGSARAAVRAFGVRSISCAGSVFDGAVTRADVVLDLDVLIDIVFLRSASGCSILRGSIVLCAGLLAGPAPTGTGSTDEVATPARLLSDELRPALARAVRLFDAASRSAVVCGGALACDELLAVAQPNVLRT